MSTEEPLHPVGERRRRRRASLEQTEAPGAGESAPEATIASFAAAAPEPVTAEPAKAEAAPTATAKAEATEAAPLSRRQLREARALAEATAAQAAVPESPAAPVTGPVRVPRAVTASATSRTPVIPNSAAAAPAPEAPASPSAAPNRRSMREGRATGQVGPAGRGERVPAQRPVVRTPLAAQGVRSVDETGALTGVRSTRASDDSPVEVTGPLDWSSSMLEAVPAQDAPASAEGSSLTDAGQEASAAVEEAAAPVIAPVTAATPAPAITPSRRSVLSGRAEQAATAAPAWEPVLGEGRGATVPRPQGTEVPDVEGVFDVEPDAEVSADAEGVNVNPGETARTRPAWMSALGFGALVLLGVGAGAGIYALLQ